MKIRDGSSVNIVQPAASAATANDDGKAGANKPAPVSRKS